MKKEDWRRREEVKSIMCGPGGCGVSVTRPMWGRGKIGSNFEEWLKSS
jgi:hypothetical protein